MTIHGWCTTFAAANLHRGLRSTTILPYHDNAKRSVWQVSPHDPTPMLTITMAIVVHASMTAHVV